MALPLMAQKHLSPSQSNHLIIQRPRRRKHSSTKSTLPTPKSLFKSQPKNLIQSTPHQKSIQSPQPKKKRNASHASSKKHENKPPPPKQRRRAKSPINLTSGFTSRRLLRKIVKSSGAKRLPRRLITLISLRRFSLLSLFGRVKKR